MEAMQSKMDKMEMRQNYRNVWHTDLLNSTAEDPPFCCFATLCGPCASYMLRKRALYNDMSRYTCCGGFMPCSGNCGESHCPEFCLCTEVFLCFANSVASTRFMLQDEFNIQTTQCDNCIIGFMFCLQQLACIFSIIACILGSDEIEEASQLLNCLADLVYCMVCPCMQTQHKVELDKRDGVFGPAPAMAVPPVQQMSRMDLPLPPAVGYPPPPPYGYPSPPPGQSYPPPGQPYPPPGQHYPPSPGQPYPPSPGHQPGQPYSPPGQHYPPSPGQPYPPSPGQPYPPPPGQPYPPMHGYAPPPQGYPTPNYPPPGTVATSAPDYPIK